MDRLFKDLWTDIAAALGLLTRLRLPLAENTDPARCYRMFPLVGALIGFCAGVIQYVLLKAGLPPLGAAALTLGAAAFLTGALHEDGLSDTADGFGGGGDRESKLAIMRDSRIGSFGALALIVTVVAKASALAALPAAAVIPALVVTHALSRGGLAAMVLVIPFARQDGLARSVGEPSAVDAATSLALAILLAILCLAAGQVAVALIVTAAAIVAVGILALRQIGGVTGDSLGAAEQVAETAVLLALAASL